MTQTIQIATATGTHHFDVEVAKDEQSQRRGLSGRPIDAA